jgi:hypothetical protein
LNLLSYFFRSLFYAINLIRADKKKNKINRKELIRKEMSRSIGPDYQQQVLQIELKELNKN